MVGIGVGVGIWETRCGGGGWGAWQEAAPRSGVWCLLELIAKAMTPHPSGSGRSIGYEWARH